MSIRWGGRQFFGFVIANALACTGSSLLAQCGPATATISGLVCTPQGEEFVAEIRMTNSNICVSGGQFFVDYSIGQLEVVRIDAGDAPFTFCLFCDAITQPGRIRMAISVPPGPQTCTRLNRVMARITFRVVSEVGRPYVRFRFDNHDDDDAERNLFLLFNTFQLPILVNVDHNLVSLLTYAGFQDCMSGADVRPLPHCECEYDLDFDEDVDVVDYQILRESWLSAPPPCD